MLPPADPCSAKNLLSALKYPILSIRFSSRRESLSPHIWSFEAILARKPRTLHGLPRPKRRLFPARVRFSNIPSGGTWASRPRFGATPPASPFCCAVWILPPAQIWDFKYDEEVPIPFSDPQGNR